jgi:putative ubiquitin-RnfH superfamily antitoxin RatB of RatAB toxin-antitoxin module
MGTEAVAGTIRVEVAYATPERQALLRVEVPTGCTVEQAIGLSGICEQFPGLCIEEGAVGIFSRKVPLHQVLREADRVEIYRPLIADPKEARRKRASIPPGKKGRAPS